MDESWRVSIGSVLPRRRSTEETRGRRGLWAEPSGSGCGAPLGPDDFRDVFGGPPRTVILRRFSGELQGSSDGPRPASFYDELFRATERPRGVPRAAPGDGRGLPAYGARARVGVLRTEDGFYDDIFGSDGGGVLRSRSKSKSKSSSSVLSSEDLSPPIRAASMMAEDAVLSSFASKLRPITIPSKRYVSSPSTISREEWNSQRTLSVDPYPSDSCFLDAKVSKNKGHSSTDHLLRQRSHIGFSCCFSPPETVSLEASFRRNHDELVGCDNSDADSPSSGISSAFMHDPLLPKPDRGIEDVILEVEGHREAAGSSSYMIEIDGHGMGEREGAAAIDEAIAWAKQKFWSHQMSKGFDEQL
ncbi:hypothetical protein Cni_G20988 [Canna indica]|uniref:Uncharacterized protein n=1 Tax=Canna indica TaxID=4628 RepID=A0AAQ3KNP7_9LILI|nr:hypothetical protein Cni_G20988 [Canna indica]